MVINLYLIKFRYRKFLSLLVTLDILNVSKNESGTFFF